MDALNPGFCWGKREDHSWRGRRTLRSCGDAVELYRVTEGATIAQIAGELGITDATLSAWIKAAGVPVRGRHASTAPVDLLQPAA